MDGSRERPAGPHRRHFPARPHVERLAWAVVGIAALAALWAIDPFAVVFGLLVTLLIARLG